MQGASRAEMLIPFGATWYRTENVELKKVNGAWALNYSGEIESYTPDFDTYRDFLDLDIPCVSASSLEVPEINASLPKSILDEAGEEALKFSRKWGPLGLWYKSLGFIDLDEDGLIAEVIWLPGLRSIEPLGEYWLKNHTRRLKVPSQGYPRKPPPPEVVYKILSPHNVFKDYFEHLRPVVSCLQSLKEIRASGTQRYDFHFSSLNFFLDEHPLRPRFAGDKDNSERCAWVFDFKTLPAALAALYAQELIGKVDMRPCRNCGNFYDALSAGKRIRSVFCSNKCMIEYPEKQKREDPVMKYRRKLQARLKRRPGDEVSEEEADAINEELLAADSLERLKAIESKHHSLRKIK